MAQWANALEYTGTQPLQARASRHKTWGALTLSELELMEQPEKDRETHTFKIIKDIREKRTE